MTEKERMQYEVVAAHIAWKKIQAAYKNTKDYMKIDFGKIMSESRPKEIS